MCNHVHVEQGISQTRLSRNPLAVSALCCLVGLALSVISVLSIVGVARMGDGENWSPRDSLQMLFGVDQKRPTGNFFLLFAVSGGPGGTLGRTLAIRVTRPWFGFMNFNDLISRTAQVLPMYFWLCPSADRCERTVGKCLLWLADQALHILQFPCESDGSCMLLFLCGVNLPLPLAQLGPVEDCVLCPWRLALSFRPRDAWSSLVLLLLWKRSSRCPSRGSCWCYTYE